MVIIRETYYVNGCYGPNLVLIDEVNNSLLTKEGYSVMASINHKEETVKDNCIPEASWYLSIWCNEKGSLGFIPLNSNLSKDIDDQKELIEEASLILNQLEF